MGDLLVLKDSNGDFVCPVCHKPHLNAALADQCLTSHEGDRDELALNRVNTTIQDLKAQFMPDLNGNSNTLGVNERLVLMMLEDYVLSREQDIVNRGKVSALSMQLSKNVNEALSSLNKLKYGTKSLSVTSKVESEVGSVYDVLDKVLKKPAVVKKISDSAVSSTVGSDSDA